MRPTFRLLANGSDITHLLSDRLLSLVLTDKPGLESDTFELVLDDRDGAIALPARGAWLDLFLGYAGEELAPMGRYRVDALRFDGPPRRLTLSGRAGDMHGEGKSTRCAAWENARLARIVFDLAARNHWSARCPVQVNVARAEQLNESDFNFITRLARQHDCTAKLADGLLLVLPRQAGESASGRAIAPLELMPGDVGSFDLRLDDRTVYRRVKTCYQDPASGAMRQVALENPKAPEDVSAEFIDRHPYPDRGAAEQAARARLADFNRGSAFVRLQMPGRSDLFAERSVRLSGFKDGLDGEFLTDSVEQRLDAGGWSTTITCNGGAQGKADAVSGKGRS
ncbi:phage late control D family protein [Pseudomonas citronellolis]|uniref:phage late control D family protein n=1 Tax=Pseudomonas citronellolis TaxID=53408 RepID=UPI00209EC1BE|nr:phage protein D [Pseudomonas citronellolis]MCP1656488.1 phage protein D [Pseudomonas citronellolis]MCP1723414.1 phage protein D [Pseudomonas citronellolis]